jgi:carbamoyl-phosphate synthase large subunit
MNKYMLELPEIDESYVVPSNSSRGYLETLNSIISSQKIDLLHPQPDSEVRFVSENRDKIGCKVFLPSRKVVRTCQDKLESALVWKRDGMPVPESMGISGEGDLEKAAKEYGFPFWLRATHGAGARGSTMVENMDEGVSWIRYWRSRKVDWNFMSQEYLPGRNIAFQSLWKDGEPVCSQARERIEYIYPYLAPSGITGTPTVARTISDEEVNKAATQAVRAIDPDATGIFCVDLKGNKEGVPCPTEINVGRFFTTSFFFTKAGINMPHIYVKLAFGESLPSLRKYNCLGKGIYWIRHLDSEPRLVREGEWRSRGV